VRATSIVTQQKGAKTMTRIVLPLAALTATFALALPAAATPLTRTFVSAAGSDANPCTITQPCASFAHAYSLTAANGIIAALDPGKYGPLTITGAITINGKGWAAITAPAAGNGITITAGTTDNVALIGLAIDGAGAGYDGIVLNSAGSLTVSNCTVQNFINNGGNVTTGNGILIQPSSGTISFVITNTIASNNGRNGVYYLPSGGTPQADGVITHLVATSNGIGISIDTSGHGGATTVVVSNSIASNSQGGFFIDNGAASLTVSIDNTSVSGNGGDGISALGTSNVILGRSVITGNSPLGIHNATSPNTFFSYNDNRINSNVTDIGATPLNYSHGVQ
jgi:hypothetical protein